MRYYSTNSKTSYVTLSEAVLKGLASDAGLFMPETIPALQDDFVSSLEHLSFVDIAHAVIEPYLKPDISTDESRTIVEQALNFPVPLHSFSQDLSILELFHGPTLAFKDVGARFMAGLLSLVAGRQQQKCTILVATSGDTGSAVARGFLGVENIQVILLYPKGKVSDIQEKQFTTLGQNITALEVVGSFDDCQQMVKKAFLDPDLSTAINLASANSINIARLLPQMFYYFAAWGDLAKRDTAKELRQNAPIFVVPSGNFGNITAGILAQKMGLPIAKLIAATNANRTVERYLETGNYQPQPSVSTISNAMDVGNPSNLARIRDLFQDDITLIKQHMSVISSSEDQTRETIAQFHKRYGYIVDPHTAVGVRAWQDYRSNHPTLSNSAVVLATAHPAKFSEVVFDTLGVTPDLPDRLASCLEKEKHSVAMQNSFSDFKQYLLDNLRK